MPEPPKRVLKRYICRQLNPNFGIQNINTQGAYKMSSKTCCVAMGIQIKVSMIEGNASSLVALRVMCYYCYSNNSRTVRLISLASGQRKIRRKFRRISMHLLLVVGDGGTYLSQSFPLFFPFSRFHSTYHMVHTVHFEN